MTKGISCILPIIHDKKFDTDFSKKANLFHFLENSAQLLKRTVLPWSTNTVTDQFVWNIEFAKDDIQIIIYKLNPNNAHVHEMIRIHKLSKQL